MRAKKGKATAQKKQAAASQKQNAPKVKTTPKEKVTPATQTFNVFGRVIDRQTKQGIAGLRVEAWDKDLISNDRVGSAVTTQTGTFRIKFTESNFRELFEDRQPDLFFKIYYQDALIKSTEDSVLWNVKSGETNVGDIEVEVPDVEKVYQVKGCVREADGTPIVGAVIKAFAKELRTETLLGDCSTDESGSYIIGYAIQSSSQTKLIQPDLVIRAFDQDGNEIASSEVIYNAREVETADLIYGNEKYRGPTEHLQLMNRLTPLLKDVALADLTEEDITFLSNKTGIESQKNAHLARAAWLAQKSEEWLGQGQGIDPQVLYALFSQNLPTSVPALLSQRSDIILKALAMAVSKNIIPQVEENVLRQTMDSLRKLVIKNAFQPLEPFPVGRRCLGDLLKTTGIEQTKLETFLDAYITYEGTSANFWNDLPNNNFKDTEIEDLKFAVQLGILTNNHLPLVQQLQLLKQNGAISNFKDLIRFKTNDWLNLIKNGIGTPADVPGKDKEAQKSNYAKTMVRMLEDAFPMTVIAFRIEDDVFPGRDDLHQFFQNVNASDSGFNFAHTPIDSFLVDNPGALNGIAPENVEELTRQLKTMQRLYKVTPRYGRYEAMRVLMNNRLNSACSIARMGQSNFVANFNAKLGSYWLAKTIYANAAQTAATAQTLMAKYSPTFSTGSTNVTTDSSEIIKDIPNWESLFGSLSLCECEHCRSVLSPAAYLVDLLAFLKNHMLYRSETGENGVRGYEQKYAHEVLLEEARRPDIGHLELTCENTNTPVPYVDLVLEVLENAVSSSAFAISIDFQSELDEPRISDQLIKTFSSKGFSLSPHADISVEETGSNWQISHAGLKYNITRNEAHLDVSVFPQTCRSAEEISANPEHPNMDAYSPLATAVYPWDLPFDLPVDETRAYLEHLGIPRYQLMERFQKKGAQYLPEDIDIACEYLGLTTMERQIITASVAPPEPLSKFWGMEGMNWIDELSKVPTFLEKSKLNYQELLELFETRFANPHQNLSIVSVDPDNPATCDLTKLEITNLDEAILNKTHRFIRLWRKLGWSAMELDKVIAALQASDIDDDFLLTVSLIQRLRTVWKAPVMNIMSWWANIDTDNRNGKTESLYDQLFLNKIVLNPEDKIFLLNTNRDEISAYKDAFTAPPYDPPKISNHATGVLAALQISDAELSLLVGRKSPFSHNYSDAIANSLDGGEVYTDFEKKFATSGNSLSTDIRVTVEETGSKWLITDNEFECSYLVNKTGTEFIVKRLLFGLDYSSLLAEALNLGKIPDELRQKFDEHDISLSDNASVIVEEDNRWLIADNSRIYDLSKEEDFLNIYAHEMPEVADVLNLENLSHLYRLVTLAKARKLSIKQYLAIKKLSGRDPFNSQDPLVTPQQATRQFVDLINKLQASSFNIAELNYLIRHVYQGVEGIAPTEEQIALILSEIRGGLQKIAAENAFVPDPSGDLTRDKLAILLPENQVGNAMSLLRASSFLFGIKCTDTLQIALNNEHISFELSQMFEESGLTLSRDASASMIEIDAVWLITDQNRIYNIRKEENKLQVYADRMTFVHVGAFMFGVDCTTELQEALNSSPAIPDILKNEFKFFGFSLSDQACVAVDEPGSKWHISDDAQVYSLRLEEGKVNVYPDDIIFVDEARPRFRIACTPETQDSLDNEIISDELRKELSNNGVWLFEDDGTTVQRLESGKSWQIIAAERLYPVRKIVENVDSKIEEKLEIYASSETFISTYFADFLNVSEAKVRLLGLGQPDNVVIDLINETTARLEYLLKPLLGHLCESQSESFIKEKLASALDIELSVSDQLLNQRVKAFSGSNEKVIVEFLDPVFVTSEQPLTTADFPFQFSACVLLHKIAMIISKFEIKLADLPLLFNVWDADGWLDCNDLPLSFRNDAPVLFLAVEKLIDLRNFSEGLLPGEPTLFKIMDRLYKPMSTKDEVLHALSQRSGWNFEDLQYLTGANALAYTPEHFKNPQMLLTLKSCFAAIKRLGAGIDEIWRWSKLSADFDDAFSLARSLKQTVKAKYNDEQWRSIAKPLRDPLREKQRNALVSYLVHKQGMNSPYNLYAKYLIDVEMSPCMMTSRIKFAISSVQLFIQRCLMNLEVWTISDPGNPENLASAILQEWKQQWSWMKNYRVWEANRKIFLYPENWIEPELRDDKSPFFEAVESELLQCEMTAITAEKAFLNYLERLDSVARLEICGMYHELETEAEDALGQVMINRIHVFGRTKGTPPRYYYRRLEHAQDPEFAEWTPWENVDADIQGNHLIPIIWKRRLHLFWPIFTEKPDAEQPKEEDQYPNPRTYWEIQICWSEYMNGRWTTAKITNGALNPDNVGSDFLSSKMNSESQYFFRTGYSDKRELFIDCYVDRDPDGCNRLGRFLFTGYDKTIDLIQYGDSQSSIFPSDTKIEYMDVKGENRLELFIGTANNTQDSSTEEELIARVVVPVLGSTPSQYTVSFAHQFKYFLSQLPLFYQDYYRTFFIVPRGEYVPGDDESLSEPYIPPQMEGNRFYNPRLDFMSRVFPGYDEVSRLFEYWEKLSPRFVFETDWVPSWQGELNNGLMPDALAQKFQDSGVLLSDDPSVSPFIGEEGRWLMADAGIAYTVRIEADKLNISKNPSTIIDSSAFAHTFALQNNLRMADGASGNHLQFPGIGSWKETGVFSNANNRQLILRSKTSAIDEAHSIRDLAEKHFLFKTYYHSYVYEFIEHLNRDGIDGLLQRPVQLKYHGNYLFSIDINCESYFNEQNKDKVKEVFDDAGKALSPRKVLSEPFNIDVRKRGYWWLLIEQGEAYSVRKLEGELKVYQEYFEETYIPVVERIKLPYPFEDVDFEYNGAYSSYNWEMFFHIPLLIADRLSKNQQFDEAQKWFHYIFDPTDTSVYPSPQKYWRVRPFFEQDATNSIQDIMDLLHYDGVDAGLIDRKLALENTIDRWRKDPFKPHLIARQRISAYQKTVVMKYLDNLIAWGDQLFRRDTTESINEATQLYILAAEILGKKNHSIPPRGKLSAQTFNQLQGDLDSFSNAMVQLENLIPASNLAAPLISTETQAALILGPSLFLAYPDNLTNEERLYFGIPKNDKLQSYWDTVADRLFKIRHCMNVEGIERQLPLFEPPIDPGILVRAVAAGVDISSALNNLYAPLPHYRFQYIFQKAVEFCNEVKALGTALLAALEKKDAERLALIRANHEIQLLKAATAIKEDSIAEAEHTIKSLNEGKNALNEKYQFFSSRLPDKAESHAYATFLANGANKGEIEEENEYVTKLEESNKKRKEASDEEYNAAFSHCFPDLGVGFSYNKATFSFSVSSSYGGSHIGNIFNSKAGEFRDDSAQSSYESQKAAIMGEWIRRKDSWIMEAKVADKEMKQIDQQIEAAKISEENAKKNLDHHLKQIELSEEIDNFYKEKFTNEQLYSWNISRISTLYFQGYQLAFDLAKRAEKAFCYELGIENLNYIQFGYWDNLKKGLLTAEQLHFDLKRMEAAYMEKNRREYEITKHISLAMFDPLALVNLKEFGECYFDLPEIVFDLDYPGHYMRRIKSIRLTIPCVAGPYTGVNCTLTLLENSVRKDIRLLDNEVYSRTGTEDLRFADNIGAIQSIVTSSGQNDSGVFELNFRDERYLPFEGAGAISAWHIEMPKECNRFDFDTISDVVIHLNYTAREGGELLKAAAKKEVENLISQTPGLLCSFSAKHDFPDQWHRFQQSKDSQTLTLEFQKDHFPFSSSRKETRLNSAMLFLKFREDLDHREETGISFTVPEVFEGDREFKLPGSPIAGMPYGLIFEDEELLPGVYPIEFKGEFNPADVEDVLVFFRYSVH